MNQQELYIRELELLIDEVLLPIYNTHLSSCSKRSKTRNQLIHEFRSITKPALLQPKPGVLNE